MRNSIWEYIDLSHEEKEHLWDSAVFVFDTNVLLNLYRYSSKTSNMLFNAITTLSDRVWIPHQIAYEFMKNRCEVIYEVCSKYDSFEKDKDDFLIKAKSLSYLQDSDQEVEQLRETLEGWTKSCRERNIQVDNPNNDFILGKLLDLFNGKTGTRYDTKRMIELFEEGEKRFNDSIPPGYEDIKKSRTSGDNIYGDFIAWMQIIDFATDEKRYHLHYT